VKKSIFINRFFYGGGLVFSFLALFINNSLAIGSFLCLVGVNYNGKNLINLTTLSYFLGTLLLNLCIFLVTSDTLAAWLTWSACLGWVFWILKTVPSSKRIFFLLMGGYVFLRICYERIFLVNPFTICLTKLLPFVYEMITLSLCYGFLKDFKKILSIHFNYIVLGMGLLLGLFLILVLPTNSFLFNGYLFGSFSHLSPSYNGVMIKNAIFLIGSLWICTLPFLWERGKIFFFMIFSILLGVGYLVSARSLFLAQSISLIFFFGLKCYPKVLIFLTGGVLWFLGIASLWHVHDVLNIPCIKTLSLAYCEFYDRIFIWNTVEELSHKNFLWGIGNETFLNIFREPVSYRNLVFSKVEDICVVPMHAHNFLLEVKVSFGAIGVFLFLCVLTLCIIDVYRDREKVDVQVNFALLGYFLAGSSFYFGIFYDKWLWAWFGSLFLWNRFMPYAKMFHVEQKS